MSTMRAKLRVAGVSRISEDQEGLNFEAVGPGEAYPEDGSDENNTYAKYTPMASLSMTVQNPDLIGKFNVGDEFYVDFTKAGEAAMDANAGKDSETPS